MSDHRPLSNLTPQQLHLFLNASARLQEQQEGKKDGMEIRDLTATGGRLTIEFNEYLPAI